MATITRWFECWQVQNTKAAWKVFMYPFYWENHWNYGHTSQSFDLIICTRFHLRSLQGKNQDLQMSFASIHNQDAIQQQRSLTSYLPVRKSCITLIEELDTENDYKMIEKQEQADIILPNGIQKEVVFAMVASDISDRREETLSGKNHVKIILSFPKQIFFLLLKLVEWQSWIFVL